jgi:hypothetical protein
MVFRNAAVRSEVLTLRELILCVQVAIKFVYIGIGAAVASYLREFLYFNFPLRLLSYPWIQL